MPIRIYALAKELNVENKAIVDVCNKVGISGKGSALASLSEDEEAKVRAYLASGGEKKAATSKPAPDRAAPAAPERPRGTLAKPGAGKKLAALPRTEKPVAEEPVVKEPEAEKPKPGAVKPVPPKPPEPPAEKPVASKPEVEKPKKVVGRVKKAPAEPEKPAAEAKEDGAPKVSKAAALMRKRSKEVAEAKAAEAAAKAVQAEEEAKARAAAKAAEQEEKQEPEAVEGAPVRPGNAPVRKGTVGPLGGRKLKVMGKTSDEKKDGDTAKASPRKPVMRKPVIKLPSMPDVQQPAAKKAAPGEKAQKPDVRLPKDAISKGKKGDSAPLKEFTEAHQKRGPAATGTTATDKKKRGKEPLDPKEQAAMSKTRTERKPKRGRRNFNSFRRGGRRRGPKRDTSEARKNAAVLQLPCTVRTFSEVSEIGAGQVIKFLMVEAGMMVNINAELDEDTVELLMAHFEPNIEIRGEETLEDELITTIAEDEDSEESLQPRPPVVTFLGHVDHGKTSLLDYLIGINVVKGEAGGITQHIRAYDIEKDGQKISFVDTPGHAAFTEMRARGANVTDIIVLVVAADDGVMPQTEEAISHAKAAGVPIIVALNKIDLPSADENKALQDLATHELLPSEWGGDIEVIRTSAIAGTGMDDLLENILTIAELHEYKANPDRAAQGICLEAEQEPGRGVIAKVIVQRGTLNVGDIVVCGSAHGRVKALYNTLKTHKKVDEAGPSIPVNITGLDVPPEAGDAFYVLDDIAKARDLASQREFDKRSGSLSGITTKTSYADFVQLLEDGQLGKVGEKAKLNLIVRADVRGSIEAIEQELSKFQHPEVEVNILQASVGGVTAADVALAEASQAVIIAFNVIPDDAARSMIDERGVDMHRYDVIYKVTDDIKLMLEGKLKPEERFVELGSAVVLDTFTISRIGTIAGCRVMRGTIERNCRIRVNRDSRTIGDYGLDSLKRKKDDVKDVRQGMDCGIKLQGFDDVKVNDLLEAYKIEEVARTL